MTRKLIFHGTGGNFTTRRIAWIRAVDLPYSRTPTEVPVSHSLPNWLQERTNMIITMEFPSSDMSDEVFTELLELTVLSILGESAANHVFASPDWQ